jgi:hypothetical protein
MQADRISPAWPQAAVLFDDGQWRTVTIVAWCRYRHGWAALLRWRDGQEDWRRYEVSQMTRSHEHLGSWG